MKIELIMMNRISSFVCCTDKAGGAARAAAAAVPAVPVHRGHAQVGDHRLVPQGHRPPAPRPPAHEGAALLGQEKVRYVELPPRLILFFSKFL